MKVISRFNWWKVGVGDVLPIHGKYHPSISDYQIPGSCNRWIFRCLNMEARLREITQDDFNEAFDQANNGIPTY